MSFTAKQLEEALGNAAAFGSEHKEEAPVYLNDDEWDEEFYPVYLKNVGDEEYVNVDFEEMNGGEGEGDYCDIIISTGSGDSKRYFKKEGQYSSYEGMDFEYGGDLQEVEKKEVKVMQWTPKK